MCRMLCLQKEMIISGQLNKNKETMEICAETTSATNINVEIQAIPSTSMATVNNSVVNSLALTKSSGDSKNYSCLLKFNDSLLTKEQLDGLFIEMSDFMKAFKSVQPSAKREGFATVPDVTWDDIGSLQDIRNELQKSIMVSFKFIELI